MLLVGALLTFFSPINAGAQVQREPLPYNFVKGGQQAGIRLGLWSNQGEESPGAVEGSNNEFFQADLTESSFMLEGFWAWRFSRQFGMEISAALVNRGDISFLDQFDDRFYGSLLLYPIMAKARFYVAPPGHRLQPYLLAGGGVIHGRASIQLTTSQFYFEEDSETDFNFTLGGGIDYALMRELALNIHTSFTPVNFGNTLVLANSYDGFAINIGISYLLAPGKKKDNRPPRRY